MLEFLIYTVSFWLWTLAVVAVVIVLWRRGEWIARAPALDVVVSLITWGPWLYGALQGGWEGFLGTIAGEFLALQTFCIVHQKATDYRGPTIRATLNRISGTWRNHLGLWLTLPALPAFLAIRFAELFFYPFLVWVLKFPRYEQGEWVNVSRQKFEGLIGHDLVWCLYCDWMTGVYSLGAELLRNIESFWCPIKFYPGKKCENCRIDFPDLEKWVPKEGTMKDVEEALLEHYEPGEPLRWWGHPDRERNWKEDE